MVFYVGGIMPILLSLALIFALPESARFLALKGQTRPRCSDCAATGPGANFDTSTQFVLREENKARRAGEEFVHEGRAFMTAMLWFAFVSSLLGHTFLTSWLPTVLSGEGCRSRTRVISGALSQFGGAIGSY